jgi:NAD(P)-dependent dehydrogenase (short-subunit alcohol dehydrogenase family)
MIQAQSRGTVLVTGGTDGLGRAAAILLAQSGYQVFSGSRSAEHRAALDQFARDRKLPLETLEVDVCDTASVNACVTEIENRVGPVDVLVNNAGIAIAAVMEEITLDDLHRQYETNVFGVLRVTQRVLPKMRERRRGRIVNMSSIAGKVAIPILGPYSSSKHALEAISDALRIELGPFGVRVVLIEPGVIKTSINATAESLSAAYVKGAETSPYKAIYMGFRSNWKHATEASRDTPEDCARVILRAVEEKSPRARYLVTREAKVSALMKRFLPDGVFDNGVKKRLRLNEFRASAAEK